MNISSPTDFEFERMTESQCPFHFQCEECEYDCDENYKKHGGEL